MFCVAGGDISLAWAHRWLIPIPRGRKGSAPASPTSFESEVCVCCCLSPYTKRCCPQLLSGMATDRGATHLGKKMGVLGSFVWHQRRDCQAKRGIILPALASFARLAGAGALGAS